MFVEGHAHNGHTVILNCVSRIVSRVFVGLPLCRNPEWLETSVGYTLDAFAVAGALRDKHWAARPFIYFFLDSRRRLQHRLATARKYLVPILKERAPATSHEDDVPLDLLQWMVDSAQGSDRKPERLSHKVLFLCLASIHTSTMSACHALYDLCAMPEYINPLRNEIQAAIGEENGFTFSALNKMKKLDSFLKESQRMNHPGSRKSMLIHGQLYINSPTQSQD